MRGWIDAKDLAPSRHRAEVGDVDCAVLPDRQRGRRRQAADQRRARAIGRDAKQAAGSGQPRRAAGVLKHVQVSRVIEIDVECGALDARQINGNKVCRFSVINISCGMPIYSFDLIAVSGTRATISCIFKQPIHALLQEH